MNVIQLQDMLRGLPDDRLKQELSQPTGSVPQYLVLSEVVRRDKMRESAASAPQSTVVQDVIGTPQQAQPQAFANGGFISPAQSMANAGVRGFAPQPPKPPIQFGMNNSVPQMFTPNTTPPPPAPVTNNNINVQAPTVSQPQPQFDGGQNDGPNAPSYYEQPNGYADGGVIGLADGDFTSRLIGAESSFNPKAKNPRSSAGGLGQFIDSTWLQYLQETQPGLVDRIGEAAALKLKEDPKLSTNAVDWYKSKNTGVLKSAGYEPSEGNLYLAHFLGGQGAKSILGADPTTPAVDILGEKVVSANPFLKGMSAADVINWSKTKIGGSQPQPSITMASMNPADREAGILSGGVMPDPQKRGIGSLFADAMGDPDVKEDMRDLGASLFAKSQERQVLEPPPMQRGDPSLVQNIGGPSVDQILAQYQALRSQYMADGGTVRLAPGGFVPPPATPGTVPAPVQQAPSELVIPPNPSAAFLETLTPEEISKMSEEELTQKWADFYRENSEKWRTRRVNPRQPLSPGQQAIRTARTPKEIVEANRLIAEEEAAEKARSAPPQPAMRKMFTDDFRATPNQLFVAKREAEKAAEEKRKAAEPSEFDKFLGAYKESQDKIAQMYREQAEAERAREAEAGGLPFLLRQLGIGMIATGGPLGEGVRGGLQQAFAAREEQTKAARDRIRELQLKGKMTDIEASGELAKLRYQASLDAQKAAREGAISKEKYFEEANKLDAEIVKAIGEGATPESIAEMRQLAEMYRTLAGLPAKSGGLGGLPAGVTVREK